MNLKNEVQRMAAPDLFDLSSISGFADPITRYWRHLGLIDMPPTWCHHWWEVDPSLGINAVRMINDKLHEGSTADGYLAPQRLMSSTPATEKV